MYPDSLKVSGKKTIPPAHRVVDEGQAAEKKRENESE